MEDSSVVRVKLLNSPGGGLVTRSFTNNQVGPFSPPIYVYAPFSSILFIFFLMFIFFTPLLPSSPPPLLPSSPPPLLPSSPPPLLPSSPLPSPFSSYCFLFISQAPFHEMFANFSIGNCRLNDMFFLYFNNNKIASHFT